MEELVNIPALLYFSDGGTEVGILNVLMVYTSLTLRIDIGKSVSLNSRSWQEMMSFRHCQLRRKNFPEKPLGLRIQ